MQYIYLEKEKLLITPVNNPELLNNSQLISELFQLLSDKETLKYLPEKLITTREEAESWLGTTLINMYCGRNLTHFILSKKSRQLVGIIDIIPPEVVKEHYQLSNYPFFLEFYLKKAALGSSIMSVLLPEVIRALKNKGLGNIAAVVNRQNGAACRVLQKAGFQKRQYFDHHQDLYALN